MDSYREIAKKMIAVINESSQNNGEFAITKNTPQFGDVRQTQEDNLKKTIGQGVNLDEKSLVYHPNTQELIFKGHIPALNTDFMFVYNDRNGQGCYITSKNLSLTDENLRNIGKLKAAYDNWKDSIVNDDSIMDRLGKLGKED